MEVPARNPRRIQGSSSISVRTIPKQYHILGLTDTYYSLTRTSSLISGSIATKSSISPPLKPKTLSGNLSILIKYLSHYFDLFHSLPLSLIDRKVRMERPTETVSVYGNIEIEFSKCLSGLQDTLWSTQTQLKDGNKFLRKIFLGFEYHIKKYLARCLKGWRGMFLLRSCTRHYRSVFGIRRVLRKELEDVKDIMDSVGTHCKDMLLNVEVEVIEKWLVHLNESKVINKEVTRPKITIESPTFGAENWCHGSLSPPPSKIRMERLFQRTRLST